MISPLRIPKGIAIICIASLGNFSLAAQSIAQSTSAAINPASALKNISKKIQFLSIGDIIIDIKFANVLKYKSGKAKLSELIRQNKNHINAVSINETRL